MNKKNNWFFLCCVWIMLIFGTVVLDAAVIGVTTTQDHVAGSLRAAITEANTNGAVDTIILPAGTYILSGTAGEDANAGGDLDFNSPQKISIVGDGIGLTIIDGNQGDRVIHIHAGVVSISGVTIRNGQAPHGVEKKERGKSGGGIYNAGTLTLKNCAIEENTCGRGAVGYTYPSDMFCPGGGGHGGGIYNTGSLTLSGCQINSNFAGDSGGAISGCDDNPKGGSGGGIYNSSAGTQVLDNCTITNNSTGNGGWGDGSDGEIYSGSGDGGGIFNEGSQTLRNCTISSNQTGMAAHVNCDVLQLELRGNGGGIFNNGPASLANCILQYNATSEAIYTCDISGAGGGIFNRSTLTLENCTLANNHTGTGGGAGGAIYHAQGVLTLLNSTINNNNTGDGSNTNFGVSGGHGGGIFNAATLILTHCTISQNKSGNGSNSSGLNGGHGGSGGGIYSLGDMVLTHCTVAGNATGSGGTKGTNDNTIDGIPGYGGGIFVSDSKGSMQIENTIIGDNHVVSTGLGPDCYGPLYSKGYNLLEDTSHCLISGTSKGNVIGQDPMLASLADNGGPTKTHALLQGSPAIDSGYRAGFAVDQRGFLRPVDIPGVTNASDGSDIGAYEQGLAPTLPPRITLSKTRLVFGSDLAGSQTGNQSTFISNSGSGVLHWKVSTSADWLHYSHASGTGNATLGIGVTAPQVEGTYTGTVTISDPNAVNSPQRVEVVLYVYGSGTESGPLGSLDTPVSGMSVSGSIPVTGWAVDALGIQSIKLYREPLANEGESLVFIGDCIRVEGARPDVALLYPDYPESSKAGWGYMLLTHFLPNGGNGSFTLHVIAQDIENYQVTLGKTVIMVDNAHAVKPFGSIDTPVQGGAAAGSAYVNFGWALTPLPNTIPLDGSTITVWVDGVALGHPVYNQPRQDIITLFPGYNNTHGAVGYYYLDTRSYANGVHTIAWSVRDDAGNTEGIGSRYFTIQNGGTGSDLSNTGVSSITRAKSLFQEEKFSSDSHNNQDNEYQGGAVSVKTGYEPHALAKTIYPDPENLIRIDIQELERLELHLGLDQDMKPGTLRLVSPPIGSYLDAERGIFYWQPGVGFRGQYHLLFTQKSQHGDLLEKEVVVHIHDKQ